MTVPAEAQPWPHCARKWNMQCHDSAIVPWSLKCRHLHNSLNGSGIHCVHGFCFLPSTSLWSVLHHVSTASLDTIFSGCSCCRLMKLCSFSNKLEAFGDCTQTCKQLTPSCCYAVCIVDTLQWFIVVESAACLPCLHQLLSRQTKQL